MPVGEIANRGTALLRDFTQASAEGLDGAALLERLHQIAKQHGFESRVGVVAAVGQTILATHSRVHFQCHDRAWSAEWPEWAVRLAETALLHRRAVWVVSQGDPTGPALVAVHILGQDAD